IRLQNGVLKTNMDTFIHDEENPMVYPFEHHFPDVATANAAFKPASVTADASADATDSYFESGHAGNYYYAVAAIGAAGQGLTAVVKTAQVAVAAGKKVVLTITQSASGTESGYAIYRGRQNGTNATDDLRLVKTIAKSGATT